MFLSIIALLNAKQAVNNTPVRATFGDGQVLMGAVDTRTLRLITGTGPVDIPLSDVGEVVPVEGGLVPGERRVDVWLRNGSELRGEWADAKLAMSIRVGGESVPVDLPLNDLNRFQLQGGAVWPSGPVFRVRTSFGDDFLVDPSRTQLTIDTAFGTLSPFLSECVSAAPIGDPTGEWQIALATGTILKGKLHDGAVTVALPMGPDEMTVPLDKFVSLRVESWQPVATVPSYPQVYEDRSYSDATMSKQMTAGPAEPRREEARPARGGAAAPAPAGEWFDNSAIEETKKATGE